MHENSEISVFNEDLFNDPKINQNSLEPHFSEVESVELEGQLWAGEQDNKQIKDVITHSKEYFSKENLLEYFRDDKKRRILFERLTLLTFTLSQMCGNVDVQDPNLLALISANAMFLDETLKYVYELRNSAGEIEIYNENDSDELRRERIKFFLSDDVYQYLEETGPVISKALEALEQINKHAGYKAVTNN